MSEQRQARRLVLSAVRGEVLVPQPLLVTRMSRKGMQVETSCPLLVDSLHEFRLLLDTQAVVIKGRVVHSRISDVNRDGVTYVSGIEFVELPERTAEMIQEFLAAISGHRDAVQRRREPE